MSIPTQSSASREQAITTSGSLDDAPATSIPSRLLALGTVAGPVLFLVSWIVLGLLQPATKTEYGLMGGVSGAITNPISALGVGPHARLFNAAFVFSGVLMLIGVVGIFQSIKPSDHIRARWINGALLALSPVGLALAGVFTLARSIMLHNVAALLLFGTPVIGFLTSGFYFRRIANRQQFGNYLSMASPLTLFLLILFASSFNLARITAGVGVAGLTERILLIEIHAWYFAMGWLAFHRE